MNRSMETKQPNGSVKFMLIN